MPELTPLQLPRAAAVAAVAMAVACATIVFATAATKGSTQYWMTASFALQSCPLPAACVPVVDSSPLCYANIAGTRYTLVFSIILVSTSRSWNCPECSPQTHAAEFSYQGLFLLQIVGYVIKDRMKEWGESCISLV